MLGHERIAFTGGPTMVSSKAMILGCAGHRITAREAALFAAERPWGLILFARNIGDAAQVAELTAHFRDLVGRPDAPVFIDQEGGRVQRIRAPIARRYPPARPIGALHAADRAAGLDAAHLMGRLIAADLTPLGITVDCLPVLDVPQPGSHDVIGDRAFASDPDTVIALGQALADGLIAGGVLPVMKHIPGHGRTRVDSHSSLPRVDAPLAELRRVDFAPFVALSHLPMAMTAHIVFAAIDAERPATTSAQVINDIVRGAIGFDGLLVSDDLFMDALSGDLPSRTRACLSAGCDIALICHDAGDDMEAVMNAVPDLTGASMARAERALAFATQTPSEPAATPQHVADLNDRFDRLLAQVA